MTLSKFSHLVYKTKEKIDSTRLSIHVTYTQLIPVLTKVQDPVVRKVDNSIHWINTWVSVQNPVESAFRFPNIFPLDSDSSFEQPGPKAGTRSKI